MFSERKSLELVDCLIKERAHTDYMHTLHLSVLYFLTTTNTTIITLHQKSGTLFIAGALLAITWAGITIHEIGRAISARRHWHFMLKTRVLSVEAGGGVYFVEKEP